MSGNRDSCKPVQEPLFFLCGTDCRFVISWRFPLFKSDRPRGTGGQTVAQAITVVLPHKLCFAVNHCNCAFMAGSSASAAACARVLIDLDNSANHVVSSVPV